MSNISDMEKTIQTIKDDNEELVKENISLRRHLGGYKTSNDNYKKQVAELKARVEHYKALDLEGDHLYEDKIDELEKTLERKKVFIEQLQEKAHALLVEKAGLESSLSVKEDVINDLKKEIIELSKPWWKKLF